MPEVRVSYVIGCKEGDVDDVIDQLTDWYTANSLTETYEGIPYAILSSSVTVERVLE